MAANEAPRVEPLVRRSVLRHALGDFEGAAADARRATERAPRLDVAHYRLGTSLYALGDLEGAAAAFVGGLKVTPGSTDLRRALDGTLAAMKTHKGRKSLARPMTAPQLKLRGSESAPQLRGREGWKPAADVVRRQGAVNAERQRVAMQRGESLLEMV